MNKLNKRIFGMFLIVLSLGVFVAAQESASVPRNINGGVLNGKATQLAKPVYPPAAKAVNASGSVNVQVTIDENGNVIEATAVSGHPLLRAASVEAARSSKFSPTLLSGQPVKVTGIIVYNFMTDMTLPQIGFAIGSASAKNNAALPANTIRYSLPSDWEDARQITDSIANKQNFDRFKEAQEKAVERKTIEATKPGEAPKAIEPRRGVAFVMGDKAEMIEVKESYETLFGSLSNAIQNRLSANEIEKWKFALGIAAGKLHAEMDDDAQLRQNLADFKALITNAPTNAPSDLLGALQKIATLDADGELDAADKAKIESFVVRLR